MIHSVTANQRSFHSVMFSKGLNVVLADRAESSTEKDTRNGLGKSTLIEIIDFCLGSRARKGEGLLIEPLKDWAFTLDITLGGNRVKVTRSVHEPNSIVIDGPTTGWIEQPDVDEKTGQRVLNVDRWRTVLGAALFGIPDSAGELRYKPSYRSLVSYFIRRRQEAYANPFRHYRQQKPWDIQLHVAYLLGLNWEYVSRWQSLKDEEEGLQSFEKAVKVGVLKDAVGTIGELETQRIRLEQEVRDIERALASFRVHPQYQSLQRKANELTASIHELLNSNAKDKQRLEHYAKSIQQERPPDSMSLERLYEEAGAALPEVIKRSLEEAREFHAQIIANRRAFLEAEMVRLREAITAREMMIQDLTDQRAALMAVLESHGALEEFNLMQGHFIALQGLLDRVRARLEQLKKLKERKSNIKAEKAELVRLATKDHEERRNVWSEAVRLFNHHSQVLYRSPGDLIIDVGDRGYTYQVKIERSGSEGIDRMKVYCFDLVILQLQMQAKRGIDFLIHDSLIYDSVDARQRARALELAHEVTTAIGGQYICTLNSDMVPVDDFSAGFDLDDYVRLRLSDADPSGSLLGIRFERP